MKRDELQQLIERVEELCLKSNIQVFYGNIMDNSGTEVWWQNNDISGLDKYLQVLKNAGVKILTLSIERNEISDEEITNYIKEASGEELEVFKSAASVINGRKGQVVSFTLTFFQEGISYYFDKDADWRPEYATVQIAIEEHEEEPEGEVEEDRLNDEEIERAARKLIEDSKYIAGKDRFERGKISTALLQKEGINHYQDIFKIQRKAEEIFAEEIQPRIAQELAQKIKELKEKGLKKIEVRGKLGISENTLNKYWY